MKTKLLIGILCITLLLVNGCYQDKDVIDKDESDYEREQFKPVSQKVDYLCNRFCEGKNFESGDGSSYGGGSASDFNIESCVCYINVTYIGEDNISWDSVKHIVFKIELIPKTEELICVDVPIDEDCVETCTSWRGVYEGWDETRGWCNCYNYEYGKIMPEYRRYGNCSKDYDKV